MSKHTFITGDAVQGLAILPDRSVQCVVTSPPYFQQRDYGVAGQIGQEVSPDDYVDRLVAVFREIRRVLRDDGCVWLNLGDSHAQRKYETRFGTVKARDLFGIPWMVAFALRSEGYFLRTDCIWSKTNPKPSSQKNAPAVSHEYLFFLSKKGSGYYFDHLAIKEPLLHPGAAGMKIGGTKYPGNVPDKTYSGNLYDARVVAGRTKRSVWSVATASYGGGHYAVFPQALIEPCIKAGTSHAGCCSRCGSPYAREVVAGDALRDWQRASGSDENGEYRGRARKDFQRAGAEDASALKARILAGMREQVTVGWRPTCTCGLEETVPCVVLDPFFGRGTVAHVARELNRSSIGIDLDPGNVEEARRLLGLDQQTVLATGALEYEFLAVE